MPAEGPELHRRCAEIFGIQCAGLAKRIEQLPPGSPLNLGISGGLDSTLALLVTVTTCDMLGLDRGLIHGLTMPGFGTTQRTRTNALALMEHLGVASETIEISELALQTFQELGHRPFGIDCRGLDVPALRAALARVPREALVAISLLKTCKPGCVHFCSCQGGSSSALATCRSWPWAGRPIMATT